jgi:hypothetical protein
VRGVVVVCPLVVVVVWLPGIVVDWLLEVGNVKLCGVDDAIPLLQFAAVQVSRIFNRNI